jgi:hypothetical protein
MSENVQTDPDATLPPHLRAKRAAGLAIDPEDFFLSPEEEDAMVHRLFPEPIDRPCFYRCVRCGGDLSTRAGYGDGMDEACWHATHDR